ncbi:MAG TPA: radical SAM family heme chaperone HemW [Actinomycetota bacterium]
MRRPEARAGDAGIYVHIPFCLTRCGYCDFNAHSGLDHLKSPFVEALLSETELAAPSWEGVRVVSIFLGGGTPTTLAPEALGSILDRLRERFDVASDAEVTCEANPDTLDLPYLQRLRERGVTRLSVGAQSFDPAVLSALQRIHSVSSVRRAFAAARAAGFDDVSLDLIYGARGETLASWERTLGEALALGPDHLSCYALTIERGTLLGREVALGLLAPPEPDLQADMYEAACDRLVSAGYEHYELSNWARPRAASLHNLGYWTGRPYLGLGPGAHSFREGVRRWNLRSPERYVEQLRGGMLPTGGEERPSEDERRMERLLLGLRLAEGVPASWLPIDVAEDLVARGLARRYDGRVALTDPGMLLANEVVLASS